MIAAVVLAVALAAPGGPWPPVWQARGDVEVGGVVRSASGDYREVRIVGATGELMAFCSDAVAFCDEFDYGDALASGHVELQLPGGAPAFIVDAIALP